MEKIDSIKLYNKYSLKEKIKAMGPGILIVGSFMGPGSITSATRAGARYGYTLLWTIAFSIIAVIVLQEMAARVGIVTQNGLAEVVINTLKNRPIVKKIMVVLIASTITIGGMAYMGGDLIGTALGVSEITGIPSKFIAPVWGLCILFIINRGDGDAIKSLEKLLAVAVSIMVFVFILTMIIVKPNIVEIIKSFVPRVPKGSMFTSVALIGTTVVPYNMFIHATSARKTWKDPNEIPLARFDTNVNMIIGGLITAGIMISSGTILRGMAVTSAADMAIQLEPVLGNFARPFLCLGMIAAGISTSIVTPLGVSYVLAGLFDWKMNKKDKRFFITNILVVVVGIIVSSTGYNPLSIIMVAQGLNGVFLPIVVVVLLFITNNKKVMGEYKNTLTQNIFGTLVGVISLVVGFSSIISLF